MRRRRVAILVGQADEEYQSRFIEGFLKQAFQEDLDTCIFSMYRKYQDAADREVGESNIFSLFVPEQFDAVIFLKDTIQIDSKIHELEQRLHDDFKGPVLVIEQHSDLFPSVFKSAAEVDAGSRLPYAALLICQRDDLSHFLPPKIAGLIIARRRVFSSFFAKYGTSGCSRIKCFT